MDTKDEQSIGPAHYLPRHGQVGTKRPVEDLPEPNKIAKTISSLEVRVPSNDTESKETVQLQPAICTPTEATVREEDKGVLMVNGVLGFGAVESPNVNELKLDQPQKVFKILVDQSGSMAAPNTGSDIPRIELVKETVRILQTRLLLRYPGSSVQFFQFSSENQYEIRIPLKDGIPDTSGIHSNGSCATDPSKVLGTLFATQEITAHTVVLLLTDDKNADDKPIKRSIQLANGKKIWVPVVLLGFTSYTPFQDPKAPSHIQEAAVRQNGKYTSRRRGPDITQAKSFSLFDARTAPGDTYCSSDGTDPLNPYVTIRVMPAPMAEAFNGFTPTTAVDSVMAYLLDWGLKYTTVSNENCVGIFLRFGGLTLRLDAGSSMIVPFDVLARANGGQGTRALYFTY